MHTTDTTFATKLKVGIFTVLGLLLIGAITVFVNDRPYWWKSCQLVHIRVDDATGLKSKSPVRSLGLEIGFLSSVELSETFVSLGICVTAPVEILPETRAYINSEGFLGDKYVELKPVRYVGERQKSKTEPMTIQKAVSLLWIGSAQAADPAPAPAQKPATSKEVPMGEGSQDIQRLVRKVDELVGEFTGLTSNLRQALNPEDLRKTMKELNRALENASRTLSPEGGLTQTAQRTLAKLEDAIEQLRAQLTRINQGQGSVGMLLNDPSYAEEIREAIRNVNRLLTKVGDVRFVIDLSGDKVIGYDNSRGSFKLGIWPKPYRYYLVGLSFDPRGRINQSTTTTTAGGVSTTVQSTQVEQTGVLLTGMLGYVFHRRLDLSVGALHGDGAASIMLNLGPPEREEMLQVRDDVYARNGKSGFDSRTTVMLKPWSIVYFRAGLDSVKKIEGKWSWSYGAGIRFDDEDIKLLFTLR